MSYVELFRTSANAPSQGTCLSSLVVRFQDLTGGVDIEFDSFIYIT